MGMEFGQWSEWNVWADLGGICCSTATSTTETVCARPQPYLPLRTSFASQDFQQAGFEWILTTTTVWFVHSQSQDSEDFIITVCNFTPQPHSHYHWRAGAGFYTELFNSDASTCGSNMGNLGGKWTDEWSYKIAYSIDLLPP